MGEKGKKKGFVIGPKGDEISEYEYRRLEKIRRNKERLESLGLDKAKPRSRKSMRSTSTDLKHNHRDENSSNAIFPARRSKRLSGKKPELNSSDLDLVEPPPNNPPTPIFKPRKRARIYNTKNYRILTEKERQSLKNVDCEDFIEDLIYFMQFELHNSDQNCRNVRKTLTRLVRGEGVPHKRSDLKGNVFQKGFKIMLADDIPELLLNAKHWVDEHGGDVSNGWLIEHPLTKMINYQIARVERGRAFNEK